MHVVNELYLNDSKPAETLVVKQAGKVQEVTTRRRELPGRGSDSILCVKSGKDPRGGKAGVGGKHGARNQCVCGGGVSLLPQNQNVRGQPGSTHVEVCDLGKVTPPLCVSVSTLWDVVLVITGSVKDGSPLNPHQSLQAAP